MEVKQLPLSSVFPSPMNPRKTFDEAAIQELADNIERQGLLQPITVRPVRHPSNEYGDRPDKYEIVCGERRYRALCELRPVGLRRLRPLRAVQSQRWGYACSVFGVERGFSFHHAEHILRRVETIGRP